MKYFVESLPETCEYCDCCHTKPYDSRHKIDGEKFCGILNEDVEVYYYHGNSRPEFCPLVELPKKYECCQEIVSYEEMYADEQRAFKKGWNTCLEEVLG